jgi:pimeloyl-ACP methyl ester carboxylesterase
VVDSPEARDVDVTVKLPGSDSIVGTNAVSVPPGASTVTVPLSADLHAWLPGAGDQRPATASHVDLTVTEADAAVGVQEHTSEVPVTIAPRPVVFLHGMWGTARWWDPYTQPGGFLSSAHPQWKGFAVDTMNTGSAWAPLAAVNTVKENADLAWAFIQSRMHDLNAHEVDVVAHSLGGVIARRMLHDPLYGTKAQNAIRTVVTLGTPNGGSPCSDALIVPGNRELTIPAMNAFNEQNPGYPGVRSVALYSGHWSTTCFADGAGDSMVPVWSVLAQPVDVSERLTPGVDHDKMTGDSRVFNDYVKPALTDPSQ